MLFTAYLIYKQTASTFGHKHFLFEKTPKQYQACRLLPKYFFWCECISVDDGTKKDGTSNTIYDTIYTLLLPAG